MKRFEYLIQFHHFEYDSCSENGNAEARAECTNWLCGYGNSGWEAIDVKIDERIKDVAYGTMNIYISAIFKREPAA